jgi:hypothetical protein
METIQRALKGAWSARTEKNKKRRFSGKRKKKKKEEIKCAWWGREGRCLGQISGFCTVGDWLADNVLPSNRIKLVFYCANVFTHASFFLTLNSCSLLLLHQIIREFKPGPSVTLNICMYDVVDLPQ